MDGSNHIEEMQDGFFKITIDTTVSNEYFEELLLHECIHALQMKLGYQDMLINYNRLLCKYANNIILDIDVNRRLINDYHYVRKTDCAQNTLANKIAQRMKILTESQKQPEEDELKILAISIAYLELCYTTKFKQTFWFILDVIYPQTKTYYAKFCEIVHAHPETSYRSVHQIQIQAIDLLEL